MLVQDNERVISDDEYHELIQSKLILDELKETEAVRTLLELTEEYNDVLLDGEPAMLITEMAIYTERYLVTLH
jgi:hypothetical protein